MLLCLPLHFYVMKTILIADDHHIVRKGVESLVTEVFGAGCALDFAKNGQEVFAKLLLRECEMLITDLNMPNTEGLDMVFTVLKLYPDIKILVFTVNPDNVFAALCLKAGVYGFVSKDEDSEVLRDAIYNIGMGKRYMTTSQALQFANSFINGASTNPFSGLSKRELEVTLLLLKGHGAIEVANTLSIGTSTASSYRGRIFEKLGIKNVMKLSRLARQFHIVEDYTN